AHNGVCLTVTAIHDDLVTFDLMQETLRVTNLGALERGDRVNFEIDPQSHAVVEGNGRSGHMVSTSKVIEVFRSDNNHQIRFLLPEEFSRYLFAKGYIGVDGISLTIGRVSGAEFDVNLIPETLARTNIGGRRPGDRVNIEIDPQTQAIVETVERLLQSRGLIPLASEATDT
ncbi:MAG: riboflavin synthase subunit alpha, partial [Candidatus Omnitrophica bacterium]|nr:riboflavin synthase subunit alpha [Candidatus Omnitrophota bacterium]